MKSKEKVSTTKTMEMAKCAEIIHNHFFSLKFRDQLKVLLMYQAYFSNSEYVQAFDRNFSDYIDRIFPIVYFSDEFRQLNSTGRKYIRQNLMNKFHSDSYQNQSDVERYGYSKEDLIHKYSVYEGSGEYLRSRLDYREINPNIVSHYVSKFSSLPTSMKESFAKDFYRKNNIVNTEVCQYFYPESMSEEFEDEMSQLLLSQKSEYDKMYPGKRMEFIKYIVEKQIPRALVWMSEESQRNEVRKHGRHGNKSKVMHMRYVNSSNK